MDQYSLLSIGLAKSKATASIVYLAIFRYNGDQNDFSFQLKQHIDEKVELNWLIGWMYGDYREILHLYMERGGYMVVVERMEGI